jgi:hypothetical protein
MATCLILRRSPDRIVAIPPSIFRPRILQFGMDRAVVNGF